jgi:DNA-binding SARP family transcriptional activator
LAAKLRGRQVPLLLAYLVLDRHRPFGREELIGALWPEHAPQSQDAALRTLLSRLRTALGRGVLVGRDAHAQRADRALQAQDPRAAWALAQVPLNIATRGLLPGAQAAWLESRRRELSDVRLHALEVIGRAGLALGGGQLASGDGLVPSSSRSSVRNSSNTRSPSATLPCAATAWISST